MEQEILNTDKEKHQRIVRLCILFFVCFLLIFGCIYFSFSKKVNSLPANKISHGISIGSVDVSGLTVKQAQKKIEDQVQKLKLQEVIMSVQEQEIRTSLETLGFSMKDEEKILKSALNYGKKGNVWSRYFQLKELENNKKVFYPKYSLNHEMVSQYFSNSTDEVMSKPKDASIKRENGEFVITDGENGMVVDEVATIKTIEKKLNENWNRGPVTIKVSCKEGKPKITRKDLETIQDELGSYETYCPGDNGRLKNIANGTQNISGAILMPGEEFSAGDAMKPLTTENGYVEAGAFENGEVVQSVAGGICQVSSTLYNAVIAAELEVTERHPHSMTVSYVKASRDAAIAGDHKDFKFKNTLDTPVYIEGVLNGRNLVFHVYGKETRPENRKIEFVSEVLSTTDSPITFTASSDPIGVMERSGGGHKGVSARLWKVVYEDGVETGRTIFNESKYQAAKITVTVGTASSNPEASSIVQSAVKSQDQSTIESAIAQAKAKEAEKSPEAAQPEEPQPETPQPETPQPETPQPETPQPETPQPEASQETEKETIKIQP